MHQLLHSILEALLNDASNLMSTPVSYQKDLETMRYRWKNEGLSFLTITLPRFCTDVFRAVELGEVNSNLFLGWKKRRCLPAFLQGFTELIFDTNTGRMLDNADISALSAVRQIGSFFKKIKVPCTVQRTNAALEKYRATDRTLDSLFCSLTRKKLERFSEFSRLLVGSLFYDFEPFELRFHHGPGATADARKGNQKYAPVVQRLSRNGQHTVHTLNYFEGLEPYFPRGRGIIWNTEESLNRDPHDVHVSDFKDPVHVTVVPKTLKTPRVIAIEPTTMVYIQQGIKDYIVHRLESHELTKGHVNFTDQTVNQKLALANSVTRHLATLDLSEASDRVHNELIKLMFDSNPVLSQCLQLCRTESAKMPDESEFELNKFASMGSALCFPIEALFFFTVLLVARYEHLVAQEGTKAPSITLGLIKALSREIFVYGDDLLIPVDEVEQAVRTLHVYGNVVGLDKSFFCSYFRESCGVDAYKGRNITPIYLRTLPPNSMNDPHEVLSWVATGNLLSKVGYDSLSWVIRDHVEAVAGPLPVFSNPDHEGLGWEFGTDPRRKHRYNPDLQRAEVRTLVATPVSKRDRLSGYPALLKCLVNLENGSARERTLAINALSDEADSSIPDHLERSVMRYAIKLKRRWVPAS